MFDQNSYDQNDQLAKHTVSGFFTARGNTVTESGRYDIDLSMTTNSNVHLGVECERRTLPTWLPGQPYPDGRITVPIRKGKFSNPYSLFATVNSSCDRMVVVPGEAVTGSPIIYKGTKNRGLEGFYAVPVNMCWQFNVEPSGRN